MDNPFEHYDSEENRKQYEINQRQRALERRIRKTKQEVMTHKASMDNATTDESRAAAEEKYQKKAALLQKQNAAYNQYCKDNNLKKRSERVAVAQWDRHQAAKARAAAKKYAVDHPDSVVPKEYTPRAKKGLEKSEKTSTMEVQKFTQFHDGEDANAFFYYDDEKRGLLAKKKSGYSKWLKELSEDERSCILEYTAGGYGDINDYYRRRGSWQEINAERIEEMSKHLDSAIAKFQLKDNIVVQRGVMEDALDDIIEKYNITDNADFVGKVFHDDGYVSTTALTGNPVATTKPVLFEISVPAGTGRGAYVNELSGFTDAEYEFLLKKGADYTITGVEENAETGQFIVKMVMNNG